MEELEEGQEDGEREEEEENGGIAPKNKRVELAPKTAE